MVQPSKWTACERRDVRMAESDSASEEAREQQPPADDVPGNVDARSRCRAILYVFLFL